MLAFSTRQQRLAGALVLAVVAGWLILDCLGNQFSYTTQSELCQKAVNRLGTACDPSARMIIENCTKRIPSVARAIWIEGLGGAGMLAAAIGLLVRRSKRLTPTDDD